MGILPWISQAFRRCALRSGRRIRERGLGIPRTQGPIHDPSRRNSRTRRCSEREPADSLRDKSNVIGGWLPSLTLPFGSLCARIMATIAKPVFAVVALVAALAVAGSMLAFAGKCPVCSGRTEKVRTLTDETNASSRNVCVWNRSVCANLISGPDSVICTQCWLAHSPLLDRWERANRRFAPRGADAWVALARSGLLPARKK